jgi:hypothetical protein
MLLQPPHQAPPKLSLTQPTTLPAETLLIHSLSPLQAVPLDQELLKPLLAVEFKPSISLEPPLAAQAELKLNTFHPLVRPSMRLELMLQANLAPSLNPLTPPQAELHIPRYLAPLLAATPRLSHPQPLHLALDHLTLL